jgi:hypothetical protein
VSSPGEHARLTDPSVDHLRGRLSVIRERVRRAVATRRATDPNPDDRFRGLYVSEDQVDDLLAGARAPLWNGEVDETLADIEARANAREGGGDQNRLRRLERSFGLDPVDTEILLVAMAPDLDSRFESLYGYLHDDLTRRRASIGLALELCAIPTVGAEARARLSTTGRLVTGGLIEIEDSDRPFLTRSLRVPDRIAGYLLGPDALDPDLAAVIQPALDVGPPASWPALDRAIALGSTPIFVRQGAAAFGVSAVAASASAGQRAVLIIDLARVAASPRPVDLVGSAIREARLHDSLIVAASVDALIDVSIATLGHLAESSAQIVLVGDRPWDPHWSRTVPLQLDVPEPRSTDRRNVWRAAIVAASGGQNGHISDAVLASTTVFRLNPDEAGRAARSAVLRARSENRAVSAEDLRSGARSQNATGLERLARRIEPRARWVDLVLPADTQTQLYELVARARQRERVHVDWRLNAAGDRGRGITALFAGESGTGKTLAAEVVAAELGLDLYVIDLATVVDKYIGETEKNLDRVFKEAHRVNGVLLFDEADAIFGKRSEVRDARDRYANLEVAYLLQRMERFDGLAVLTTNLRANLDDGFTRRIDVLIDFPIPEEDARRALWRMHLPEQLPQVADLDLDFLARRFRVPGGNIRNICLTAAFTAADANRPVSMGDLIRGTEREYRKLGHLTVEAEFGEYIELLR